MLRIRPGHQRQMSHTELLAPSERNSPTFS